MEKKKLSYVLFYIDEHDELKQVAFSSIKEDLTNVMHVYTDRLLKIRYRDIYNEIEYLNNPSNGMASDRMNRQSVLKAKLDKYRDEFIDYFFINEIHS